MRWDPREILLRPDGGSWKTGVLTERSGAMKRSDDLGRGYAGFRK
jgi:hypothetical protein